MLTGSIGPGGFAGRTSFQHPVRNEFEGCAITVDLLVAGGVVQQHIDEPTVCSLIGEAGAYAPQVGSATRLDVPYRAATPAGDFLVGRQQPVHDLIVVQRLVDD